MKNKKRIIATIALGTFLTAMVLPLVEKTQELSIDKRKIEVPSRRGQK